MFDIGASELLVIVVVAILVIGPSELPRALRTAGRWIARIRRISAHFRTGIDAMIREAEIEEMEKQWKAHNEAIMARTGAEGAMVGPPAVAGASDAKELSAHDPSHDSSLDPSLDADDPPPEMRDEARDMAAEREPRAPQPDKAKTKRPAPRTDER